MQKTTTFLMFVGEQNGKAEEAIRFYTSLFEDSAVTHLERFGPGEEGVEGAVRLAMFTLAGQDYMAIDGGEGHAFTFTPAVSLYVRCDSEAEIDRLYGALAEGGGALMPLGEYPFARKFAWVADRFGMTWQLSWGLRADDEEEFNTDSHG